MRVPPRQLVAVLTVVLSVVAWAAWLAWDQEYYLDPATGDPAGPYRAWQVVGSVLTLLVAAALAGWALRAVVAAALVTVPFTVCWTVAAAGQDDTGLFVVGAVLIAVGLFLGSGAVAAGTGRLNSPGRR
ncbi:hypothetical protein [Blastococcus xanthinilyticus]|uniref:Uncharacterized protein n=1 Tax=Blastococcus xanthinilyticus TaxID=1564164 RepID=A0A5S5CWB2_9ACTN|nr:hypothetical protein [Blastococcus xanthinilyticus]TYP88080.1 hypothetical protein BD833_105256 [Blastococcus xanthinilyticus]